MKKFVLFLMAAMLCLYCIAPLAVSAKAPADALWYADFNHGPMAEPEGTMQATDAGGQLYINDGPISAEASLSDGALKLTLGTSGYYGFNNTQCAFRSPDGTLTTYKYLVLRMKGEYGTENTPGAGGLMMTIGGGDGPHMGTFLSSSESVQPFLDPDGCYMPLITKEYQYFVIALSQQNVRVNEGKLVSGINFNNSAGSVTVYIDEIFLSNEIPEGYVSSGKKPSESGQDNGGASSENPDAPALSTPAGGGTGGTVVQNVVSSGNAGNSMSLPIIIALMVTVLVNLVVIVLVIVKLRTVSKD